MATDRHDPAVGRVSVRAAAAQTTVNAAALACALARFRLAREQFPETLEALAPHFVAALPKDGLTGESYKYFRTEDGKMTLYSVGFLIPGLVLFVFHRFEGRRGVWKRFFAPLNLLVFLGVTLPWFIGLSLQHPDFPYYGLIEESFHRFTTGKFHRTQPFYFSAAAVHPELRGHRSGFQRQIGPAPGATNRGGNDGHQPMVDAASGVVAVCNGEIDNHKELRRWLADRGRPVPQATDVAVIPGMYLELGAAFAEKLVGAFAIAVWDPRERRLTLVRDRAGERPLFFTQTTEAVIFATEIASMVSQFKLPVTFDHAALQRYLRFGLFAAPASPFAGIQKVPPGGIVQIDARGVRHLTYWRWHNVETAKQKPSLEAFDKIFRETIRRRTARRSGLGADGLAGAPSRAGCADGAGGRGRRRAFRRLPDLHRRRNRRTVCPFARMAAYRPPAGG